VTLTFLSIWDLYKHLIFECEKKVNASQYKGVYYHNQTGKWYPRLFTRVGKNKCGGYFNNELDAARRVNQLCDKLKIPLKNPGITGIPNKEVTKKFLFHVLCLKIVWIQLYFNQVLKKFPQQLKLFYHKN
jgi:hypothetical protein